MALLSRKMNVLHLIVFVFVLFLCKKDFIFSSTIWCWYKIIYIFLCSFLCCLKTRSLEISLGFCYNQRNFSNFFMTCKTISISAQGIMLKNGRQQIVCVFFCRSRSRSSVWFILIDFELNEETIFQIKNK